MNSDTVKALVLQHWRYDMQSPLVALEAGGDVMCVHRRYLIENEVKVSIADLRRDQYKSVHCRIRRLLGLPVDKKRWGYEATIHAGTDYEKTYLLNTVRDRQFYFAVPESIANKATPIIEELYPYAGIMVAKMYGDVKPMFTVGWRWGCIYVQKQAKLLPVQRVTVKEMAVMIKAQSATVTRLALKIGKPAN